LHKMSEVGKRINWACTYQEKVGEQVGLDLKAEFPDVTGFSTTNLWYMKKWYKFYTDRMPSEKLQQLVGEIDSVAQRMLRCQAPFFIIDKLKALDYAIYNISKRGSDMSDFSVDFFREDDGTKPVGVFIKTLDVKMKAKVVADLHLLEEYGNMAREPLSKHLEDGIFEVRSKVGSDIVRILYFFDGKRIIIVTNGFVKKQSKTPRSEIELAKKRRNVHLARNNRNITGSKEVLK